VVTEEVITQLREENAKAHHEILLAIGKIQAGCAIHQETVVLLRKEIYGNGNDGMKSEIDVLKEQFGIVSRFGSKMFWALIGLITGSAASVLAGVALVWIC